MLGGNSSAYVSSFSVHRFDPVANSWSEVAPMLAARSLRSSVMLNGRIHVVGSHDGRQPTASVERYEVISDNWSVTYIRRALRLRPMQW
jgi:hypothetical protein